MRVGQKIDQGGNRIHKIENGFRESSVITNTDQTVDSVLETHQRGNGKYTESVPKVSELVVNKIISQLHLFSCILKNI